MASVMPELEALDAPVSNWGFSGGGGVRIIISEASRSGGRQTSHVATPPPPPNTVPSSSPGRRLNRRHPVGIALLPDRPWAARLRSSRTPSHQRTLITRQTSPSSQPLIRHVLAYNFVVVAGVAGGGGWRGSGSAVFGSWLYGCIGPRQNVRPTPHPHNTGARWAIPGGLGGTRSGRGKNGRGGNGWATLGGERGRGRGKNYFGIPHPFRLWFIVFCFCFLYEVSVERVWMRREN